MRLAIVGSTRFEEDEKAKDWAAQYIQWVLGKYQPEVVISGGAIGIDQLATTLAAFEGIEVIEHLPEHPQWAPSGFKARNLLIAQDCTHLLCLRHVDSKTYGSGWTADRAEELGKPVYRKTYRQ